MAFNKPQTDVRLPAIASMMGLPIQETSEGTVTVSILYLFYNIYPKYSDGRQVAGHCVHDGTAYTGDE